MPLEQHLPRHAVDAADAGSALTSLWARMAAWTRVLADHYEAAGVYEELSRLSDAELHRRGLSRETLARDIVAACDRSGPA